MGRRPTRSRALHLHWRERIATLLSQTTTQPRRAVWAAAADVDPSMMEAFACIAEADRKTVRAVDLLFMPRTERQAVLAAIEEWATAIERGEMSP